MHLAGVLGLSHRNTNKNIYKSSSSEPLSLDAWSLVCSFAELSFTKLGSQLARARGPRFKP